MGKVKSTDKKRDFIALLASMSDNEINEYIKIHGKPPKKVLLYRLIHKEESDSGGIGKTT